MLRFSLSSATPGIRINLHSTRPRNHTRSFSHLGAALKFPFVRVRYHTNSTPFSLFLPRKLKGPIRHLSALVAQFGVEAGRFCRFFVTHPTFLSFAVNGLAFLYFHGMEEVVGSIPARSTNSLSYFAVFAGKSLPLPRIAVSLDRRQLTV